MVISHINTAGDGVNSSACHGLSVGDPCPDIENALEGSFTLSFDFDDCGSGQTNFCQAALSQHKPSLGTVACSPGLVSNPFVGGSHCVSAPVVAYSHTSAEGDVGTLQHALNNLVDNNGVSFMTVPDMPSKTEAVTVTRQGQIRTKGGCALDSDGAEAATCSGEYEISYDISFDAYHVSGDVPPVTIVTSDFRVDTTSSAYTDILCPSAYYTSLGCEQPVGAGSFYTGEAGSIAIETVKGAQPSGMVTLSYECESTVTRLPPGASMTVSGGGLAATFDSPGYVSGMAVGQWLRFSSGNGIDHYRKIAGTDVGAETVTFETGTAEGAVYGDVEFGDYYSDWNESDGDSGVSSHCQAARVHPTLPIDVGENDEGDSVTDWRGKIGALAAIDSSGIAVTRNLVPDMLSDVGLIWDVTFHKQPGDVHEMVCTVVSGTSECAVDTIQDSSVVSGHFSLETTWPHEFVSETQGLYGTNPIRWNSDAAALKARLEAVDDADGNKVFGYVDVSRTHYVPSVEARWSGGYTYSVTFLTRGGNIPAMGLDSNLGGLNPVLEVSDEESGADDLYQGAANSAAFVSEDPGLARDGNQISGSFSLSWAGTSYHAPAASTGGVFTVQTGGSSSDRFTALSADDFKTLFEGHVLGGAADQVDVVRSEQHTQWMGYTYTVLFRHEDVGGDVQPLVFDAAASLLGGSNSYVHITEEIRGADLHGTFQLRYEGETTRPIDHDATALDIQDALNELNSIAPSAVVVSGGEHPIRTGPSDGVGGMSTQVGGRVW